VKSFSSVQPGTCRLSAILGGIALAISTAVIVPAASALRELELRLRRELRTATGEALREQVNDWIRTSGAFDGVIDFARAMQDPYDPTYLNPVDNSGDSLHPGDLGYENMAATVSLAFVTTHSRVVTTVHNPAPLSRRTPPERVVSAWLSMLCVACQPRHVHARSAPGTRTGDVASLPSRLSVWAAGTASRPLDLQFPTAGRFRRNSAYAVSSDRHVA
jgi:hypothetical protein